MKESEMHQLTEKWSHKQLGKNSYGKSTAGFLSVLCMLYLDTNPLSNVTLILGKTIPVILHVRYTQLLAHEINGFFPPVAVIDCQALIWYLRLSCYAYSTCSKLAT